ncbi:MAG: sulfotransferase domain-containing protein [Alphaproteobacteria bacterium]|nr:sulfotransferase domain-containing protein [Alphaproteobacteria bacterium]
MVTLLRSPLQEIRTPALDSRRWNHFEPRDDDIVIATFPKSGTTWMQRITDLLVFQSPQIRPVGKISPWLDCTFFDALEDDIARLKAQTHRRFVKSHLPFDALPLWDNVKYIHVARDGRDARLSWMNHQQGFRPEMRARIASKAMALAMERDGPPAAPPPPAPEAPRDFLLQWFGELEVALNDRIEGKATANLDYFAFEATYWRERRRPNLLLVHYNDLKEDLEGEMWRIAEFLNIALPGSIMPALVEAARFETMKKDGDALNPALRTTFDRGAERFINQGLSGRWRQYLGPEDISRYDAIVQRATTPALAQWLEGGRKKAGDPKSEED